MTKKALTKEEAARYLGLSPRSLADARWRNRVGMPAVKIGRSLRFLLSDLQKLIKRSREKTQPHLVPRKPQP